MLIWHIILKLAGTAADGAKGDALESPRLDPISNAILVEHSPELLICRWLIALLSFGSAIAVIESIDSNPVLAVFWGAVLVGPTLCYALDGHRHVVVAFPDVIVQRHLFRKDVIIPWNGIRKVTFECEKFYVIGIRGDEISFRCGMLGVKALVARLQNNLPPQLTCDAAVGFKRLGLPPSADSQEVPPKVR